MRTRASIDRDGAAFAALLWVASSGCAQLDRLPEDGEAASLPRSVDQALTRACATDGACHVPGNGIVVLAGASPSALVDGGYVRRGSLEGSTIAVKMLGLPGMVGGVMPPASHPADPADLAVILAWIAGLEPDDAEGSSGTASDGGSTTGEPEPVDCLQGEPLGAPPRFSELWPMLEATCAVSTACHSTTQAPAMSDRATAYAGLVDATNAAGLTFVVPGSPDDSYLWHKLVGTHVEAGGTGGRMPVGMPLCDPGLVGVYAWILGGAPQ